jgi:predicted nucleotidyltransferase
VSALQLEAAAAILGPVLDEVVFVGGATIHLWLTEEGVPPTRATDDVDVICEVATRSEYYRLGSRLRERGLREAIDEPVVCRWGSRDPQLALDVMPTDPDILGFSNPWYDEAISTAEAVMLDSGTTIRAARPAPLVATKLSAWKGRGNGDLLPSLDVHDILTLFNGRPELNSEIRSSSDDLRSFVEEEIEALSEHSYFSHVIDSAVAGYGPRAIGRAQILQQRIDELLAR